jgi:signal peptidase
MMTGSGEDESDTSDRHTPAEPAGSEGRPSAGHTDNEGHESSRVDRDYPDQAGRRRGTYQAGSQETVTQGQLGEDEENNSWAVVARDVVVTVLAVLLVGGYLFAISGVWPPMVAIESGSMEPNMDVNDMVFVMDEDRFQPAAAEGETGVVTAQRGAEAGYGQFGNPGDVIIIEPGGNDVRTPIIHRAMFWVEKGENWCDRANPDDLGRLTPSDDACEADHAGFITKGDANSNYDQASFRRSTGPVKPEWIIGTAEVRLPKLGWFRLQL